MRANADRVLRGVKALLIPYKPEHVETYHKWMVSSIPAVVHCEHTISILDSMPESASRPCMEEEVRATFFPRVKKPLQ